MKRALAAILATALLASCATGERRPVSLREHPAPKGALSGAVAFLEEVAPGESRLRVLSLASRALLTVATGRGEISSPSWAPGGERVVYGFTPQGETDPHIWVAGVPGERERLTEGDFADDYPSFSPDGRSIVFSSTRVGGRWGLFTMRADGSRLRALPPAGSEAILPSWSPDGRAVVFSARTDRGSFKVHVMDLVSGSVERITSGDGDDLWPHFSPDGRTVVFSSNALEDIWQVYTVPRAGGERSRLIGSDSHDRHPVYSPDGEMIMVSSPHLAIYRSDGDPMSDGASRWTITRDRASAPDWT